MSSEQSGVSEAQLRHMADVQQASLGNEDAVARVLKERYGEGGPDPLAELGLVELRRRLKRDPNSHPGAYLRAMDDDGGARREFIDRAAIALSSEQCVTGPGEAYDLATSLYDERQRRIDAGEL